MTEGSRASNAIHLATVYTGVCMLTQDNIKCVYLGTFTCFSALQTHDPSKQVVFSFDKAIVNLQTKLHKVEMEKEAQSHLR